MTAKVIEGFGKKFTERIVETIFTPAFIFWLVGTIALFQRFDRSYTFNRLKSYPEVFQAAILIGIFCLVPASAFVVKRFDSTVIHCLEGYWPDWLRLYSRHKIKHYSRRQDRLETRRNSLRELEEQKTQRFQALKDTIETEGPDALTENEKMEYRQLYSQRLSSDETKELIWLIQQLRAMPGKNELMPTNLGNLLRAAERQPLEKYGLDPIICWSRLWLLLPEPVKVELQSARADLDAAARIWLWSLLSLGWTVLGALWIIPLGILSAYFAYYYWAISAAATYGELIEATFDIYRYLLYDSIRWQLPADPNVERRVGKELTSYLQQGFY